MCEIENEMEYVTDTVLAASQLSTFNETETEVTKYNPGQKVLGKWLTKLE